VLKTIVAMLCLCALVQTTVWAKEPGVIPAEKMKGGLQVHGSGKPELEGSAATGDSGLAKVIKNAQMPNYPSVTFGKAIDDYRYFTKREWSETRSTNGKIYVDFTGWLKIHFFDFGAIKSGTSARAVGIKFLVKPDGSYGIVMVSRVELKTDGVVYSYPTNNLQETLKMIYENKEINF